MAASHFIILCFAFLCPTRCQVQKEIMCCDETCPPGSSLIQLKRRFEDEVDGTAINSTQKVAEFQLGFQEEGNISSIKLNGTSSNHTLRNMKPFDLQLQGELNALSALVPTDKAHTFQEGDIAPSPAAPMVKSVQREPDDALRASSREIPQEESKPFGLEDSDTTSGSSAGEGARPFHEILEEESKAFEVEHERSTTSDSAVEEGAKRFAQEANNAMAGNAVQSTPSPNMTEGNIEKNKTSDHSPHETVAEAQHEMFCYLKQHVPVEYVRRLPAKRDQFSRCAVVSNSGALLARNWGQEIDNHSAVFRYNDAPTAGYEEHVGVKDTIRITARKGFERSGKKVNADTTYIWTDEEAPINELLRHAGSDQAFQLYDRTRNDVATSLREIFADRWWESGRSFDPTTGALGMFIALALCGTIDTYEMIASDLSHTYGYHYYSGHKITADQNTWHRSFSAEKELWALLSSTPLDEQRRTGKATLNGFQAVACNGVAKPDRIFF